MFSKHCDCNGFLVENIMECYKNEIAIFEILSKARSNEFSILVK